MMITVKDALVQTGINRDRIAFETQASIRKHPELQEIFEKGCTPQCEIGIVVGCGPNVGICIAKVGHENAPWFVYDGPLSSRASISLWTEHMMEINEFIFKSGYLSCSHWNGGFHSPDSINKKEESYATF